MLVLSAERIYNPTSLLFGCYAVEHSVETDPADPHVWRGSSGLVVDCARLHRAVRKLNPKDAKMCRAGSDYMSSGWGVKLIYIFTPDGTIVGNVRTSVQQFGMRNVSGAFNAKSGQLVGRGYILSTDRDGRRAVRLVSFGKNGDRITIIDTPITDPAALPLRTSVTFSVIRRAMDVRDGSPYAFPGRPLDVGPSAAALGAMVSRLSRHEADILDLIRSFVRVIPLPGFECSTMRLPAWCWRGPSWTENIYGHRLPVTYRRTTVLRRGRDPTGRGGIVDDDGSYCLVKAPWDTMPLPLDLCALEPASESSSDAAPPSKRARVHEE